MLDKIATAIFAAFLAFPGATNSEVAETHVAQGIQCNPKGSMAEMKKCADDDYRVADRKLNEVYQQLTPKVQGEERQRLIAAQRAWIQFRDTNCRFESAEALGGTLEGLLFTNCLTKMTTNRTAELQAYIARQASNEQPQMGQVTNIVQGDIMCYVTLKDQMNREHQLGATFDICAKANQFINRRVSLKYSLQNVNDCESIEPCGKTRQELLISSMDVVR
ncbi:lysozyme inhibitor LprI family protein [Limnospira fusiformis KN01]|uniref:Lysozyme inhibitor LprI-like N-terminal domain-containing protein n=3 Tax=Limnospira TaxID=2596745 RepID=A0A9P1NZJ6_9CYAN|nr:MULTISPECIES: lysozyme inhibitor LprI family protein [Limnospira]EKD07420.1 hypothetical protein SPLC1_S410870 [Arthrospira platensis C1]MDC0838649.1 lysozyme inhibitor LprI family protein [Limnoraphis robusta]MDY7052244.1 lysozyme inhibitor LprI family protein [Limnospira fusiformis LS22]RAQ46735.1 DUF1311 domain-containing protein [Arthrospira sp. O9.13F]EDZ92619.1 protein of unknown function DUF1311 [Limnospira maxima CS-328]